MATQNEQRTARLRLLVLIPITATFLLALALVIYATNTFFLNQQDDSINDLTQRVKTGFKERVEHDIEEITGLLQFIENNPNIIAAWQTQDRQQLFQTTKQIFDAVRKTFHITHFYFHSTNGKNFIRIHRPGRFGDRIYRKTLLTSRRTGNLSAGLEIGTFGQFVLRIVKPWRINGRIVGYLELGKEINHIIQDLKSITNTEIVTLINKKLINQNEWQKIYGNQFDWGKFETQVIAASTFSELPEELNFAYYSHKHHFLPFPQHEKSKFITSRFDVADFSKANVGQMLVIQDITTANDQLHNLNHNIIFTGIAGILIIFTAYFFYLGKIETHVSETNRALHQKIDDHEQAENKLRINRDELVAINRELESYSYSIAHDLRAPLRSVTSFSQIVMEDAKDKLSDNDKDNLNRVIAASMRMAELIDDILQLSRITREELTSNAVNLSKIVEQNQFQLSSQEPNREVEWEIQKDVIVNADSRLMERALENLINNAWKYTNHTNNAKISFGTEEQHGETIYFVRDNGAGFDMNYAHKLFATFQRLHNPREFPGNGVGLAIVLRVIQRHHGRVWGEGEVGKGATFYFTLPSNKKS